MQTTHSLISSVALPSRNRFWSCLSALVLTFGLMLASPAQAQFASFNGTYPTGGVASQSVGTYQFYTYDVAATLSNSYLSFTFRNDPDFTFLDTISLALQGTGTNLLQNGGLDTAVGGIPTNWVSIGEVGLGAAGVFSSAPGDVQAGAGAWRDGAVGGFDGIAQSLATTIGSTYTISFWLRSNVAFNGSDVQTFAYFGALPPGLVITGGALPATHWLGQTNNTWSGTNWASDSTGTATTATPTATDDITFAATGAANQVNTNLDANFTINSLTVNSTTGISTAGTQSLTVNTTTTLNSLLAVNSGVTLINNGALTNAVAGTLAGTGAVQMALNQNIANNGAISVGDPSVAAAASTLSLTTSGTGAVVMGATSTLLVDLFTGAAVGDNTGLATSSDRLDLTGTLNAAAGGTLVIGNPNGMTGFAGGDQWLVVDLNGGAGTITGTLALNDLALGLTPTQVGNFDQTTGIYKIIDTKGGLDLANAQDQGIMSGIQGILGDINGRLFNLRAGWGEEPQGSISVSLSGGIDDGVIDGQGDGPEQPIAKKIPRSRQWEVFATVNYANISLSSIATQAGVDSETWAPGVGIERHFTRHLTLGFAANLLETHQSYANGLGSMDMQGIALSAYASYVRRSFWVDLLYNWGSFDLDTDRNATGFPVANGETNAWTNAVQLNGGWSFRVPAWKLVHGPLAGVDWLHVNVDGYSETGGGLGALTYGSRSVDSLITRVGWSVTREFETNFAKITPQLRFTYERQNIDRNNGTSVNLINLPFTATTTNQAPGQDYMVAGAGVNFEFSPDFSMLLTYQGQFFRENMQAHYGSVRFTYKF